MDFFLEHNLNNILQPVLLLLFFDFNRKRIFFLKCAFSGQFGTMPRNHRHVPGTVHRRNYDGQQIENALLAILDAIC